MLRNADFGFAQAPRGLADPASKPPVTLAIVVGDPEPIHILMSLENDEVLYGVEDRRLAFTIDAMPDDLRENT